MVMQTVSLCDEVRATLRNDGRIRVSTDLRYLPNDERNIAYKAASAFFKSIGNSELGVNKIIKKNIKVCEGMGGGSAKERLCLSVNTLTARISVENSVKRLRL